MKISDFGLNENQRRAVEWNEGPLLVLAGPGSGKTLVLTLRAARLLDEDPDASVLALTFTSRAADHMRQRLDDLTGGRAQRAHLCTFHSFAAEVLRQHGSHVGIQPGFSMLALDDDRLAMLDALLSSDLPQDGMGQRGDELRSAHDKLKTYAASIPSDRKSLLVLLDRLFAESYDGRGKAAGLAGTAPWVPVLFEAYCLILQESARLDYGALLFFARKLLSENPGVARLTRLAWQFVCVDEFQDTNRAQYDLLRILADGPRPNLFVVADEDQIIFQWNGASPERLLALRSDYCMELIQLPESYRCTPTIVQLANNLISHNRTRIANKQPLVARKTLGTSVPQVELLDHRDEDEEATVIADLVSKLSHRSDCAILARYTRLLHRAADALQQKGLIPYLAQRKNEFESASTRWMHAVLRLANARHDRELLRRVCVAWHDFTDTLVETLDVEAAATLVGGDFLRAWVNAATRTTTDGGLRGLLTDIDSCLVDRLEFQAVLQSFWDTEWLAEPLEREEKDTWRELHGAIMNEHSPANVTLHLYLQEIDLLSKAPARLPGSIPCLTVHGAKGLEFRHVFLVGMAEGVFPSYQAVQKGSASREMEEERRSCFVAITRAQEMLHISWARRYSGYRKDPSRFIGEMGLRTQPR